MTYILYLFTIPFCFARVFHCFPGAVVVIILHGCWIYNYLYNQCLSPLTLWVRTPLRRGVLDAAVCDQVCQWLAAGPCFSTGISVSSTNKTDRNNATEILLKVMLNTMTITPTNEWNVLKIIFYFCFLLSDDGSVSYQELLRKLVR